MALRTGAVKGRSFGYFRFVTTFVLETWLWVVTCREVISVEHFICQSLLIAVYEDSNAIHLQHGFVVAELREEILPLSVSHRS